MKKLIATLFASAAFLAPLAYSETSVATDVVVPVNGDLLTTEGGIEIVLNKVKNEARRACAFDTSISYIPMVDKKCVAYIVSEAERQLTSPDFEVADTNFILRVSLEG
jgi:UrcA family protein